MNTNNLLRLMALLLIPFLSISSTNNRNYVNESSYYFHEFLITDSPDFDGYPDIDEGVVVWHSGSSGTGIYGYNIFKQDHFIFIVSEEDHPEYNPKISNNWVVWFVNASPQELKLKNLDTGEIRTVANYFPGSFWPTFDIEENYIVWAAEDVWLYKIDTEETIQITNDDDYQDNPAIDPPWVVWRNQGEEDLIGTYNIETSEIKILPDEIGTASDNFPDVNNDILVWQGNTELPLAGSNIFARNLITGEIITITYNSENDWYPKIDGNLVVWQSDFGSPNQFKIMAYQLDTSQTFVISSRSTNHSPSISGDYVVWRRHDTYPDKNWNIYGAQITEHAGFLPIILNLRIPNN